MDARGRPTYGGRIADRRPTCSIARVQIPKRSSAPRAS